MRAEKKRDELFNRERPMVPTKIWKEKRIIAEENEVKVDTTDDPTDDTTGNENSEDSDDVGTDIDVNTVFALLNFLRPTLEGMVDRHIIQNIVLRKFGR